MAHALESKDLGSVSAYGDALTGGYDGTKEQFMCLIAAVLNGAMLANVGKSTTTLTSDGWNDGAYDLTGAYPTDRYSILAIDLDFDNATGAQIAAWYDADIDFQSGNMLVAHSETPTIDLPLVVVYEAMAAVVEIPVFTGTLFYDGTEKTPAFDGYDENKMTVSGATSGTDAGIYTAVFTPKTGYRWPDGSGSRAVEWQITGLYNTLRISKNAVLLTDDSRTATVTTKIGQGTLSIASADESIAMASLSGDDITITLVDGASSGTTEVIVTLDGDAPQYGVTEKRIIVYVNKAPIYGATWAGTSAPEWTRTDDSADFEEPIAAIANGTGASPFDSLYPWSEMKIVEDKDAGALVSIPRFYYKWSVTDTTIGLQISPVEFDGCFVSPAHEDRDDGNGERDIVYVGRYLNSENFRSETGTTPYRATRANNRTAVTAIGDDVWLQDASIAWTIKMLYLVEYANWINDSTLGKTILSTDTSFLSGATDSMQYHTGTTAELRSASGQIQYRHIEDIAGTYEIVDGCYANGSDFYIKKNPSAFTDTKSGGVLIGRMINPSTQRFFQMFKQSTAGDGLEYMLLPSEVGGSSTTYIGASIRYSSSALYYTNSGTSMFGMEFAIASAVRASRIMKLPN